MYNRREFSKLLGASLVINSIPGFSIGKKSIVGDTNKRIGIIGLDTSHCIAYTKEFNFKNNPDLLGYKIAAVYPSGSDDIESSISRVPGYIEEMKKMKVEIVSSIKELLRKVDFVLLETSDGRKHLEQLLPILVSGKRVFIDKPVAASLSSVIKVYELSNKYNIPLFSSSALRYIKGAQEVLNGEVGKVLGASTFSPALIEKTHPDLYWYGIHGVEPLFTVIGTGCEKVSRVFTNNTDIVTGIWNDGRIGVFRGQRDGKHEYGGVVFGESGNKNIGPFNGYLPLLKEVVKYFETGVPPVSPKETIEIYAFMSAADVSKKNGGKEVLIKDLLEEAGNS